MNRGPEVPRRIRFGTFEAALREGELYRDGLKVRIQDQPFRILSHLVRHPNRLVTRDELRGMLWPEGYVEFEKGLNTAVNKLRTALGDSAEAPRFVETIPRRGYRFIAPVTVIPESEAAPGGPARRRPPAPHADVHGKSIAVLPFENLSPDPEQDYFCDGITEELINALTQVGGLRVVARTSAFAFKGEHRDVREIGMELDVGVVVEGTVRKAGERIRITAQLIDVRNGYHLWSEQYDRELRDIFAIQEEISRAIVTSLRIRLVGPLSGGLVSRKTEDLEAYNLYFKGLHRFHELAMDDARVFFEQATRKDPDFAGAYVGISDCHRLQGWWGAQAPTAAMAGAREAAERAVVLDPELGAAHRALAGVKGHSWEDWPGAKAGFLRALELNPADAMTHASYGFVLLGPRGQPDKAVEHLRRAHALDPLSPFHAACLAWALNLSRRIDEAIEAADAALALDRGFYLTHLVKGWALEHAGDVAEAVLSFRRARDVAGLRPLVCGSLTHGLAAAGSSEEAAEAEEILADLQQKAEERYVPPVDIAIGCMGFGRGEEALDWLERAYEDRTPRLSTVRLDHRFDPVRRSPRFAAILTRMGLTSA